MKFKEYLKNQSISASKVARALEIPEVTVNSWKYRDKVPTKSNMKKIIEFTNGQVQPTDFYD